MYYLRVSKFVLCVVDVDGSQELLAGFLTVNELALGDGTGIQYSVSAVCGHRNDHRLLAKTGDDRPLFL